jgi:pimeloyl-ACP methyl ester carboxylesterase
MAELGADALALGDAAGLDGFHLVGHDWGGSLAWHLAATHPERLRTSAVLSTPHPRALVQSLSHSLQPLRSSYAVAWQVPVVPERMLGAFDGALLRLGLRVSGLPDATARAYVARMLEPGVLTGALNWYRAAGRTPGDLAATGPSPVPTLYVWSSRDAALGRTAAMSTGRHVTGSYRFVELERVSRWIPETVPDRAVELLVDHAKEPKPTHSI